MFILVRTQFLGLFNIPDKAKYFIGKESFDCMDVTDLDIW